MLRLILLCIFAPLAAIELLFYHQFTILLVGGLYLGLATQADWAAGRFLAKAREPGLDENGKPLRRRHWREDGPGETEEIRVNPLGGKRSLEPDLTWAPPPPVKEIPAAQPTLHAAQPAPKREPRKLPSLPRFNGRAHEVLGVHENARTRTIVNAFRHWIKQFHPDRAQGLPAELANARVRRLTEAKGLLLERRRVRKTA